MTQMFWMAKMIIDDLPENVSADIEGLRGLGCADGSDALQVIWASYMTYVNQAAWVTNTNRKS